MMPGLETIGHSVKPLARKLTGLHRLVWVFALGACMAHGSSAFAADPSSASGARHAPVSVGETAPDFTLADENGRLLTLSAERGRRVVILVFYRGYW